VSGAGARAEWRAGWPVVGGAALGLGVALPAWNYYSSLFVVPLTQEFGWTRGELARATALSLIGAFAAPWIGKFADRLGARPVLVFGLVAYAAVLAGFAAQPGSLPVYATLIVLHTGLGLAAGGAIFCRAVAGWFSAARGLALGITMSGVPLAAAFITPALQAVIAGAGWRSGYLFLAALALCVGIPATLAFVRERPVEAEAAAELGDSEWNAILRAPRFWLLFLSLIPVNTAGTGIMSQMAPLLTDAGQSAAAAALLLSIFAGAVIVARLAAGWAIDRFPPHIVAAVVTGTPALGCVVLLLGPPSFGVAAVALMLVAVQQGAEIDLVGYLIARLFGMSNYATAYGACVLALGLSGAAGVLLFGQLHDWYGGYGAALWLSAIGYAIGALLLYALRLRPGE
jgi:predicted MFS family arabinose efflux permease